MDILQVLTRYFPIESSETSLIHSDQRDEAICATLRSLPVTAYPEHINNALNYLAEGINNDGMSTENVVRHVLDNLTPGLAAGQSGPRYFGFVVGGSLPAAQCGDILTTIYDQNVQVHLPNDSISTALEYRTLEMILDLLSVPRELFKGRSLTTGATASNILGLACARDYVIRKVLNNPSYSVADSGFPAGVRIRVITDRHHVSIEKAAAVVGIGRKNVVDLAATSNISSMLFSERLDMELDSYNSEDMKTGIRTGLIVVVGFAEVNTGDFTDMQGIREVCDKHSAWLHIDAAFGALSCLLPEYSYISKQLENADSVTADAHKSFNAPYACGIFFTRSLADLTSILAGSSIPAYLTAPPNSPQSAATEDKDSAWISSIPSPLHTNLENSRRFIALPLYCALLSMGRKGYAELMERNVRFARALAEWMDGEEGGRWFECLNLREIAFPNEPQTEGNIKARRTVPLNVLLFRAKDVDAVPALYRGSQLMGDLQETLTRDNETERNKRRALANAALVRDINATKRMYVSPGGYLGGALRIAVSNWMTGRNDRGADLECVKEVLRGVMKGHSTGA